jgi:hypothetical protein
LAEIVFSMRSYTVSFRFGSQQKQASEEKAAKSVLARNPKLYNPTWQVNSAIVAAVVVNLSLLVTRSSFILNACGWTNKTAHGSNGKSNQKSFTASCSSIPVQTARNR